MWPPMRNLMFVVVALVGACSKKKEEAPAPAPSPTEAAKPTEPAVAPAPAPAPAAKGVTLAAGEVTWGCLGWSEKDASAVCLTGVADVGSNKHQLTTIGNAPAFDGLGETLDDATVKRLNEKLVGFEPFSAPATKLEANKPADANGVTLKLTVKETAKGGENQPPAYENKLVATCAGKDVVVFESSGEGENLDVAFRAVGKSVLVELSPHMGREGEFEKSFQVRLLDAQCAIKGA